MLTPDQKTTVENLRRVLNKMRRELEPVDENSNMIDLIELADSHAQTLLNNEAVIVINPRAEASTWSPKSNET